MDKATFKVGILNLSTSKNIYVVVIVPGKEKTVSTVFSPKI